MNGEKLLQQLQQMSPEQRLLDVFTRAEDVGRNRETVHNPCDIIRVSDFEGHHAGERFKGLVIS